MPTYSRYILVGSPCSGVRTYHDFATVQVGLDIYVLHLVWRGEQLARETGRTQNSRTFAAEASVKICLKKTNTNSLSPSA